MNDRVWTSSKVPARTPGSTGARRSQVSASCRGNTAPRYHPIRCPHGRPAPFAGGSTRRGPSYLIGRYYDPATGQFLSVDPAVGQTHSAYQYASDNPIKSTDPTGNTTLGDCFGLSVTIIPWFLTVGTNQCLTQDLQTGQLGETSSFLAAGVRGIVGEGSITYELSNANNLYALRGPFHYVTASYEELLGLTGIVFWTQNLSVWGVDIGLAVGAGTSEGFGATFTSRVVVYPGWLDTVLRPAWEAITPWWLPKVSSLLANAHKVALREARKPH